MSRPALTKTCMVMWQDLNLSFKCVRMLEFKHLCFKTFQQMLHCFITCTMIVNHFLQRIFFFYCLCYIQYVNRSCWSQLDACCEHFPPLGTTGPKASVLLTISCGYESIVTLALGIEELQDGLFSYPGKTGAFWTVQCGSWWSCVPEGSRDEGFEKTP